MDIEEGGRNSMSVELLKRDYDLSNMQLIDLLILVMVTSGICGFIYELFFYRIDLGYFVKRGSSFGPWIPIYAFGGLAYAILVYRFKDNPVLVFFLCVIVSVTTDAADADKNTIPRYPS
jgi:hypothetical protein